MQKFSIVQKPQATPHFLHFAKIKTQCSNLFKKDMQKNRNTAYKANTEFLHEL